MMSKRSRIAFRKPPATKTTTRKKKMCSCCGIRPVPERAVDGIRLTRLCRYCYTNAANRIDPVVDGLSYMEAAGGAV